MQLIFYQINFVLVFRNSCLIDVDAQRCCAQLYSYRQHLSVKNKEALLNRIIACPYMLHHRENVLLHQALAYQKQSIDQWQLVDIEIEQWDETRNQKVIFKVLALWNAVNFDTLNWIFILLLVKYKILSVLIK